MTCTYCGKRFETLWQRDDYELCNPCLLAYLTDQGFITRLTAA